MPSSPTTEAELEDLLLRIPNPPDADVPVGGEEASVMVRDVGRALPASSRSRARSARTHPPMAHWARKPHWEVGEALGIIDLAAGAKIAGSGFPVYKGAGAALQRGLIDWFLDLHTREHGLTEIWPPAVVNADTRARHGPDPGQGRPDVRRHPRRAVPGPDGRGPGHEHPSRRDLRGDRAADPLCRLLAVLPARGGRRRARTRAASCASTSSTRSRWSASRGPADSPAALEWLTERAEILLQRLGLAYRVLLMATGEMGFTQASKYDLEVWAPGVEHWLEVSSCSNFRDFQARRMNIRWRPEAGAEAGARAHAQRLGPGARARRRGHARDVPAARRLGDRAGRPAAVSRSRRHRGGARPLTALGGHGGWCVRAMTPPG